MCSRRQARNRRGSARPSRPDSRPARSPHSSRSAPPQLLRRPCSPRDRHPGRPLHKPNARLCRRQRRTPPDVSMTYAAPAARCARATAS
jgi:hypothetical protein